MKRVVLAILPLALLAGCGGSDPKPVTVHGTLKLTSNVGDDEGIQDISYEIIDPYDVSRQASKGQTCDGQHGYNDLIAGAEVVISSDSGKTLATGTLGEGKLQNDGNTSNVCLFTFDVKDVPTKDKYYSIKIGHRDGPKQSLDQLKAGPELTIGSD